MTFLNKFQIKKSAVNALLPQTGITAVIELKKKGASLATGERKIQRLVKEGKVRYIIKDVELPDSVQVTDRANIATRLKRERKP